MLSTSPWDLAIWVTFIYGSCLSLLPVRTTMADHTSTHVLALCPNAPCKCVYSSTFDISLTFRPVWFSKADTIPWRHFETLLGGEHIFLVVTLIWRGRWAFNEWRPQKLDILATQGPAHKKKTCSSPLLTFQCSTGHSCRWKHSLHSSEPRLSLCIVYTK